MRLIALLILACATAFADETKPKKSALRMWFEHLKQGLSESAVQGRYQKNRRVTAVAAVRGNKQDSGDPDKPAWKSGRQAKRAAAVKQERAEFGKAVDLIMEGKTAEGLAALEAFEKAHPESPLMQDVKEAKEKAAQLAAETQEKPAEPKASKD